MGSWLLSAGHDIQSTERHDISVVATTREPADNSCKKSNIASEKMQIDVPAIYVMEFTVRKHLGLKNGRTRLSPRRVFN